MNSPMIESPLKQVRQFKMKQEQDLKHLKVNYDEVQSDGDEPEAQARNSFYDSNVKGSIFSTTPSSHFQRDKQQNVSLRGLFQQSSSKQDDALSQISTNRSPVRNPSRFDTQVVKSQGLSQQSQGGSDLISKTKQQMRETKRPLSRSLHNEQQKASASSQQLLHLGVDEQKLFSKALGNSQQQSDINIPTQPLKLSMMKQSSSVKKLPSIKQGGAAQENIFQNENTNQQFKSRLQNRNLSSTPKLETKVSGSSTTLIAPLSVVTTVSGGKRNLSILNLAGSNILTPTGKDQPSLAQSALFSSQKKLSLVRNKHNTLINSPLSSAGNISKLKMQFYSQLNGSPTNGQFQQSENKKSNYGSDQKIHVQQNGFNTALQEMVDDKNVFHSLLSPESPDPYNSKNSHIINPFSYNSPLNKQGINISVGNPSNSLQANNSIITNQSFGLSFAQALQNRIGEMNYLDESKEQSQNFHSTYKNIAKMQQQADHYNSDTDLQQAILFKAYQQNVLPRKLGLIKQSENDTTSKTQIIKDGKKYLNLIHLNIGSTYHNIVSSALNHVDFSNLYSINLSHNNLTGVSVEVILQNLPEGINRVDISNNKIGTNDAASIKHVFNSKKYICLRYVNLSSNSLGDNGLKAITEAIQNNTSVYSLDLSYNKLGDQACIYLQQILTNNSYIQELYLQWNKFSSRGGLCLAAGLATNYNMKVINLSHNGMGALSNLQTGFKFLQSCTIIESGMRHLDLSYNQYGKSEALQISEVLANNTKLFGFHFQGNQCNTIIDSKGYMYFQTDNDILKRNIHDFHINQRSIDSVSFVGLNKAQSFDCKTVDNCWLCDGWQEIKFEVRAGCSDLFTGEPAFLHLDFEDYQPVYMDKDQDDPQKFVLHRMCPPGRQISFFFTDPCKNVVYTSKDYEKVDFFIPEGLNPSFYREADDELIQDGTLVKKFTVKYLDGTVLSFSTPSTINCITTKNENTQILSQNDYEPVIKCQPREKEVFYKITFSDIWHRGASLFRNYIEDTEELEDKCFEEDWNNTKIPYIISTVRGSNLDDCKNLLRLAYPQIRMAYKNLSVSGMSGDIYCISQNPFTVFVQSTEILDNNLIKIRDVDLNFTTSSSKALKTKSYRAPDKTLVRNEFMEVIVRLAIDKYNKTKIFPTAQQSIEAILSSNSFLDYIMSFERSQVWRNERYWNQQCDSVLKNHLEIIKILWNQYADSKKGEKRYYSSIKTMSIYEFKDFVMQFDLIDDYYPEKEIPYTYNLSMMTQIDELNNDKYFQMNFEEFLEALARIAEKKSMTPIGEIESQYSEQERKQLSLRYKLESFLYYLQLKYDKLFSKDKKKQSLSYTNTQTKQQIQSNKIILSNYISWADVMNERKEQLKQKLKCTIKTDQIQFNESNQESESDFKQDNLDQPQQIVQQPTNLNLQSNQINNSRRGSNTTFYGSQQQLNQNKK